ncbi:isoamylase early set domain-containing protein [Planomonospora sp. ID67723]|uniref:isoamylase early set domain-containing protein n=1 Tax=Planomonospora sp. ID67723 TaxID=2738134 RepID=UPI0018C3F448|nr:isoamylase early set domain-containing protein [Planomonospora sp. ID67723]MBG0826699.1 isoamylase early set domain-containing protein [Planomonospora sp. ID67723]
MIKRAKPTKNGQVKITFTVPADRVSGGVSLVGDFNGWDPYAHPMQPKDDGIYQVTVTLPADRGICFRYLADGGLWFDDDDADRHDQHGGYLDAAEAKAPRPQAVKAPAKAPARRVPGKQPLVSSVPALATP